MGFEECKKLGALPMVKFHGACAWCACLFTPLQVRVCLHTPELPHSMGSRALTASQLVAHMYTPRCNKPYMITCYSPHL